MERGQGRRSMVRTADLEVPELREEKGRKTEPTTSCKKHPRGVKEAKAGKKAKFEKDSEEEGLKDALYSLSNKFSEVSSTTIAATDARLDISREQAEH